MYYYINRAVVIGSGTMGAAIAAHLANAGIGVTLLDIVPPEIEGDKENTNNNGKVLYYDRNRIVRENLKKCSETQPPAFFSKMNIERIIIGNLEDDFEKVGSADWIIETVVEDLKIKRNLMEKIEKIRKDVSIVSSNTSGLLIKDIVKGRSESFKQHFVGIHFFNPPRYMKLIEIIPGENTEIDLIVYMKSFCERVLGKHVVICKDSPNFIANRYISFSNSYVMEYAFENGFSIQEADQLTGELIGHPKTATFRLNDLVGVDVVSHVKRNLYDQLEEDPFRSVLAGSKTVEIFNRMIEKNYLGNKTRNGFYKMIRSGQGKKFLELNIKTIDYDERVFIENQFLEKYLSIKPLSLRLKKICQDAWAGNEKVWSRNLDFIWKITAFAMNYSAWVMPAIAEDLYSFDSAIKLGFGHELGPFEIWDVLGLPESVEMLEKISFQVPEWVKRMVSDGYDCFYKNINGKKSFYDHMSASYIEVPDDVKAIYFNTIKKKENSVVDSNNDAVLIDLKDGVLGLGVSSKENTINHGVFSMLEKAALQLENSKWLGLVISGDGKNFSTKADVSLFMEHIENASWNKIETSAEKFQKVLLQLRYSKKPVVAAPFGKTLGSGLEIMLASSAICASSETYMGQIEPCFGVVPVLGGCKELLKRVLSPVIRRTPGIDPLPMLLHVFQLIIMNKVSGSAQEAKEWGFLMPEDRIVMKREHLVSSAKKMVMEMNEWGIIPETGKKEIYAVGSLGLGFLKIYIHNLNKAGYITDHEKYVGEKAAYILCGGNLSKPQWVDAGYILDLEREAFISLLGEVDTHERIYGL